MAGQDEGAAWPVGGGELGALIRARNWSATPLGPVADWPRSLRTIVDLVVGSAAPMVALWGPMLAQIYNDGYRSLMGGKHPAGLGQPTRDCWPELWHLNAPVYDRVLVGESLAFEDRHFPVARAGAPEDAWFTLAYSPLRDEGGNVAGILVTVTETTARVRAEAALRAREAQYRALVTATSYFTYRMTPDWTAMHQLDGRGFLADTVGPRADWLDAYIDPGDQPAVLSAIRSAIAAKMPFELEHRVRRADGTSAWTLSRAVPLLDERGAITEWVGAASDVTARRQAEAALAASEARFRGFAEASTDTLWIVDAVTGALAYLSPAYERMWGEPRAAVLRDLGHWKALLHPDDRAAAAQALPRALAGEVVITEYQITRPADGATRWVRDTGFPIRDETGAIRWAGGIAQDITDQRRATTDRERLLAAERAARGLAEAAVRARDAFLVTAAHELRTPLAKVTLAAQLLRLRESLPPAARANALATIEAGAARLATLVDDLLDVARLRTGQLTLRTAPVELGPLTAHALDEARAQDADRHRFTLDAPAALPPVVADAGRVAQVLANLLDNAVKYAPEGGAIVVTLRVAGTGVTVAVRDTGIGLPPGAGAALFAPFGRAANATARELPGMGLGLHICKGIVEGHGGWLKAESPGEGRGTTVTFWLPLAPPPSVSG